MTLSPERLARLQYLLGKHQVQHWVTPEEEVEIRSLLRRENPKIADADWEVLIRFGLVLVGTYVLFGARSSKT